MIGMISPRANLGAICTGESAQVFNSKGDSLGEVPTSVFESRIRQYGDAILLKNVTQARLVEKLKIEHGKTKGLFMFISVLDYTISIEDKLDLAESLELLLKQSHIRSHIEFAMYSRPIPDFEMYNLDLYKDLKKFPDVYEVILSLLSAQSKISEIYSKWENYVLGKVPERDHLLVNGIYALKGIARKYCEVPLDIKAFDFIKFDLFKKLSHVRGSRNLITEFFRVAQIVGVVSGKKQNLSKEIGDSKFEEDRQEEKAWALRERALSQITTIKSLINAGDLVKAERFASELVKSQIQDDYHEYACRSLSSIAEHAKQCERFDLMLKWAKQAYEVYPLDDRACGHLADAYLLNDEFELARQYFEKSANTGRSTFASAGLARIYRAKHDFEKALEILEKSDDDNDPIHRALRAEVLGDLGRHPEAEVLYRSVLNEQPDEIGIFCGLAANLTEQGKFEQAEKIYVDILNIWPNDQVPNTGLGFLLAKQGKFNSAFHYLDQGIKYCKFGSFIPINAKVSALRMAGRYGDAEKILNDELGKRPHDSQVYQLLVDVLLLRGERASALKLCDQYLEKFSDLNHDSILRSKANVLRRMGDLSGAFAIVDSLAAKHPKWLALICDKADLLRHMGLSEESRGQYLNVLQIHKSYRRAVNGIKLLDALFEVDQEPVQTVNQKPVTFNDWEDLNIGGLILLSQRKYDKAQSILKSCEQSSPFKPIKDLAVVTHALSSVGLKQYKLALRRINPLVSADALIQKALIYCVTGDVVRAKQLLKKIDQNPDDASEVVPVLKSTFFSDSPVANDAVFKILDIHVKQMLRAA